MSSLNRFYEMNTHSLTT